MQDKKLGIVLTSYRSVRPDGCLCKSIYIARTPVLLMHGDVKGFYCIVKLIDEEGLVRCTILTGEVSYRTAVKREMGTTLESTRGNKHQPVDDTDEHLALNHRV